MNIRPWSFKLLTTLFCIIVILMASFVVLRPLAQPGFFLSDDGEWMIIRLTAFFQTLRDGQLPVRFLGRLNHSYGYPVANFLYPGFLYVGSLIHGLGPSFVDSVKIILAGSVTGATILIFFWLRTFFSYLPSLFGALAFLFAPYLLFDLYSRGSVGEIFALLPAATLLLAVARGWYWLLAPAVGLLLVAHNSLSLLFGIYGAILWIANRDRRSFVAAAIGIGLASFFWIPALLERAYVVFDSVNVSKPVEYLLSGTRLVLMGPVFLLGFLGVLLSVKKTLRDLVHLAIFAMGVFLTLPASTPFWQAMPGASLIQFPYRLLAVTSVVGSYIVALLLTGKGRKYVIGFAVIAIVFWMQQAIPAITNTPWVVRDSGYYTTNEATTTVADEYMPRWVKMKFTQRASDKIIVIDGLGSVKATKVTTQTISAIASLETESIIQVNTIYYPGWGVLVDDIPVKIDYGNEYGLMRFRVPAGTHTIVVEFHEIPLRLAADAVSVGSFIVWIVYIFMTENRKNTMNARKR